MNTMKKIKIEIFSQHYGNGFLSIDYNCHKQISKNKHGHDLSWYDMQDAIASLSSKIEERWAEGDTIFELSKRQAKKFFDQMEIDFQLDDND
jgi:hypothetical protein